MKGEETLTSTTRRLCQRDPKPRTREILQLVVHTEAPAFRRAWLTWARPRIPELAADNFRLREPRGEDTDLFYLVHAVLTLRNARIHQVLLSS